MLNLTGRAGRLKFLSVTGSKLNENAHSRHLNAYRKGAYNVMDSLEKEDREILQARRNIVADLVRDYSRSVRGIAILENFNYCAEATDILLMYNLLHEEVKQPAGGREIKERIKVYSKVAVGKQAPEITQHTPDSTLLSLSSLKGKYVLIDFLGQLVWSIPQRKS